MEKILLEVKEKQRKYGSLAKRKAQIRGEAKIVEEFNYFFASVFIKIKRSQILLTKWLWKADKFTRS